jgi:predicted nuclease of predicted toxin-antitoxin system
MRFLVDAQLPYGICSVLAMPEHDVVHLKDVLPLNAKDSEIWIFAQDQNRVIVTKDEDFARRQQSVGKGPQIVWIRIGNCTNAALQNTIGGAWPAVCKLLAEGEKLIEVR